MDLAQIQQAIGDAGLDGWLFYDFRGSDPLASLVLGLPRDAPRSRRWFYFIPARGEPTRIVHAIESGALDDLRGHKRVYLAWQELHSQVRETLAGRAKIAMQYSPHNNIPYVARVDAGTIDLIRSFGVEIVTSADLVSQFAATLDDAAYQSHERAANRLGAIVQDAFAEIGRQLSQGGSPTEYSIQQYIWQRFAAENLFADHAPIVGVGPHSADPHFAPSEHDSLPILPGSWVLIDAWCKEQALGSIYADITWTGYVGETPPPEYEEVFRIVLQARDAAVTYVTRERAAGRIVCGCDVDDACRKVIEEAGYGPFFIHRTGHSLHESVHANGANMDNLESRDTRQLLPQTLFTVEPGIYLPDRFGVRSEINLFMPDERTTIVTGVPRQTEILRVV